MSKEKKGWVDWFLAQPGHQFFVRIDDSFLQNMYNYYGIKQKVDHFQEAYQLLNNNSISKCNAKSENSINVFIVEQQTMVLYGLLHARFLLTNEGMEKIFEKFKQSTFPCCTRILCQKQQCLPYGISDELCTESVKLFCPCCSDVYIIKDPQYSTIDGAYFGNSWVPIFLQKYKKNLELPQAEAFVPHLFGFTVEYQYDDSDYSYEEEDQEQSQNIRLEDKNEQ